MTLEFKNKIPDKVPESGIRGFLPAPEEGLKVSFVVPIQGEVDNGNIFFQLRDLARQKVVMSNPEELEVIYAVNNTARDRIAETDSYRENQRLFEILECAAGRNNTIPKDLQPWEINILNAVRERALRVNILDYATDGIKEKDIDGIRVLAENHAVERFGHTSIAGEGAIVMLDADARISTDFTSQILSQLVLQRDVGMLKIQFDSRPSEGGEALYETTTHERLVSTLGVFRHLVEGYKTGGWYAIKAKALGIRKPSMEASAERDFLQPKYGTVMQAEGIVPFVQDRARSKEKGGQFGANRLESLRQHESLASIGNPAFDILGRRLRMLAKNNQLAQDEESVLVEIMAELSSREGVEEYIHVLRQHSYSNFIPELKELENPYAVPALEYAQKVYTMMQLIVANSPNEAEALHTCIAKSVKAEKIRHAYVLHTIDVLLERVYTLGVSEDITIQSLTAGLNEGSSYAHFLRTNPWVVDTLKVVREEVSDPVAARDFLNECFPEWLMPFDDTSYTGMTSTLLGINEYIRRVMRDPREYPVTSKIFSMINVK